MHLAHDGQSIEMAANEIALCANEPSDDVVGVERVVREKLLDGADLADDVSGAGRAWFLLRCNSVRL